MNRTPRTIALLLAALFFLSLFCAGLVYLSTGDQLIDSARIAVLKFTLTLREDDLNTAISDDSSDYGFTVRPGDTATAIAEKLVEAGLINDAALFVTYVQAENIDNQLEAGKYFLSPSQNLRQIAQALTDSPFSEIILTIIPGQRIEQVAETIDANPLFDFSGGDFMIAVGRGAAIDLNFAEQVGLPMGMSLEGLLYPDTYALPVDITAPALRDVLIDAFVTQVAQRYQETVASSGFSLYEVMSLASIVQRETLHDDEKPKIAEVYLNRLEINMKLDADPTVQYPLGKPGDWWPLITADDYAKTISVYNTYLNNGLPPGPIAFADIASIEAVLNPEDHDFFYFRADCRTDGYHDFAKTFDQHLDNGC